MNEWNDKRSLNINRTTRVTVLKEGAVPPSNKQRSHDYSQSIGG